MNAARKMVILLWSVFLIVGFVLIVMFVNRAEAKECRSPESLKSYISSRIPSAILTEIPSAQVPDLVNRFNILPPTSHYDADDAYVISVPGDDQKTIILFSHGCFVVYDAFGPQLFEFLMGVPA